MAFRVEYRTFSYRAGPGWRAAPKAIFENRAEAEAFGAKNRRADHFRVVEFTARPAVSRETTCQICGRAILAKNGLIAHHGYQRPGHGWQTASCFGARYRPYQVACDALPPAIEGLTSYIARQGKRLAELIEGPPATLQYNRNRGSFRAPEFVDVPRPEGFDPNAERASYRPHTYESLFFAARYDLERDIKYAEQDLATLRQRLADWKAPGATAEGYWAGIRSGETP